MTKMAVGGMMDGLDVEEMTGLNKVPPGTWMVDRIPFRTRRGYIGLSNCLHVRAGDRIVLARGGATPLVLRKSADVGLWNLVGDCYVHGVMNSEAFDIDACRKIRIA